MTQVCNSRGSNWDFSHSDLIIPLKLRVSWLDKSSIPPKGICDKNKYTQRASKKLSNTKKMVSLFFSSLNLQFLPLLSPSSVRSKRVSGAQVQGRKEEWKGETHGERSVHSGLLYPSNDASLSTSWSLWQPGIVFGFWKYPPPRQSSICRTESNMESLSCCDVCLFQHHTGKAKKLLTTSRPPWKQETGATLPDVPSWQLHQMACILKDFKTQSQGVPMQRTCHSEIHVKARSTGHQQLTQNCHPELITHLFP